jgi:hypothetical protein
VSPAGWLRVAFLLYAGPAASSRRICSAVSVTSRNPRFYWPTWKQVMLALYEEGITSYLFIEGTYNNRLEYLAEMPEKSLVCHFDKP